MISHLRTPRFLVIALLGVCLSGIVRGEPAPAAPVSFRHDIAPLLQRRCVACHGEDSAKGGYRIDSYQRMSKAGDSDLPSLSPGKTKDSEIYQLLIEKDANDRMPQKAEALPAKEIALVKRWIEQGAINDGGAPDRPLAEMARESLLHPAPEKYPRPVPVTALAFSPDGTQLAVSGYYEVTIWNLDDGAFVRRIGGLPERITSLAWHPRTKLLAVGGGSPAQWGAVALVDPAANFQVRLLCDLPEMALSVAFSPDGSRLAAGAGDRTIRIFDTKSGRQTRIIHNHADWVQSVEFSSDGQRVLSGSRDRTVRISDVATGEIEYTYAGHETAVLTAMFSPDNKTVYSLARNSPMHLSDASGAKMKHKPESLPGHPDFFAWLPSAGALATGGPDGLVRVIDPHGFTTLFTLYGHPDAISALAVGRTVDQFATGSYDGTVCLWELNCGTWVRRFIASPR